ncbi:MAG: DedA family protein [Candidatus Gracilibacteria bacterium]|nr:DedA family protein [Candidatus Gracilibacteria bacterium]
MLNLFLSYLLIYKYAILFSVVFLTSLGLPLPATALIVAAGAFAAQGYFDFWGILACVFVASVLGDISGYFISRRYGKRILMGVGFKSILSSSNFLALEKIFKNRSISAIFYSRFLLTHLGPSINILSGLSKIPGTKFITYDVIGEILYAVIFTSLGYIFANQWEMISSISQDIISILVLSVLLLILLAVLWRMRNGKKK